MFFTEELVFQNAPAGLSIAWVLATLDRSGKKVSRRQIESVSVPALCHELIESDYPMSLRLLATLLHGTTMIYETQLVCFSAKVSAAYTRIMTQDETLLVMTGSKRKRVEAPRVMDDPSFDIASSLLLPPIDGSWWTRPVMITPPATIDGSTTFEPMEPVPYGPSIDNYGDEAHDYGDVGFWFDNSGEIHLSGTSPPGTPVGQVLSDSLLASSPPAGAPDVDHVPRIRRQRFDPSTMRTAAAIRADEADYIGRMVAEKLRRELATRSIRLNFLVACARRIGPPFDLLVEKLGERGIIPLDLPAIDTAGDGALYDDGQASDGDPGSPLDWANFSADTPEMARDGNDRLSNRMKSSEFRFASWIRGDFPSSPTRVSMGVRGSMRSQRWESQSANNLVNVDTGFEITEYSSSDEEDEVNMVDVRGQRLLDKLVRVGGEVPFSQVASPMVFRAEAARRFYDILWLANTSCIKVAQVSAFGQINISFKKML